MAAALGFMMDGNDRADFDLSENFDGAVWLMSTEPVGLSLIKNAVEVFLLNVIVYEPMVELFVASRVIKRYKDTLCLTK